MVHQELNQALTMSVMDNMWLGRFPYLSKYLPIIDKKEMKRRTDELFADLGIKIDSEQIMSTLSVAKRQLVEIAKAVSYGAKLSAFDEPTSSLNDDEAEILFGIIERLKRDGCGIIYISHKMAEILRICDRVTIMRDGKYITTEDKDRLTTDKIISLMVGRELKSRFPERKAPEYRELLRVEGLSAEHSHLRDISFTLGKGEILGIAGLDGAGRTELLETIFGLAKKSRGEIILEGKQIQNRSARESKKNGFALLTEERRASGIFGILSIRDNTTVSNNSAYSSLFLLRDRLRSEATAKCIKSMRIKTPSQSTKISTLSGGNQQKVILGRWLLTEPKILMLDEPTRGIDVGAKYEIYLLITELSKSGRGVIVVSSEMPELLGLCDRILVLSNGRVAGEVNTAETSQEEIMTLSTKNL